MAETLLGKNINESYEGLLKTSTNNILATSNQITDGLGNITSLTLGSGSNGSCFAGSLAVDTSICAGGNLTTASNLIVNGTGNFDNSIRVVGNTLVGGNLTATNFSLNGVGTFGGATTFNNSINVKGFSSLVNTCVDGTLGVAGLTILKGGLQVTGTITATSDIIAFSSSDSRLKDNLIPINSENFVNNLTGYEFDWNDRSKRSGKGKGIIAQDLLKIDESLVRENSEGFLTVDYIGLIPVLIEEVKRLGKEIEKLKSQ
jgi:hypothetical protein